MTVTTPFSRMLLDREMAEVGTLDTPEKEAGLLVRLRKAAATIADPDLARTYKDFLVGAFYQRVRPSPEERKAANRVIYRDRKARSMAPIMDVTPEARAAAITLARAPRPVVAAIVEGLITHPDMVRDRGETLATQSFGDAGLDRLISDLVSLT
jgi:DNA primase